MKRTPVLHRHLSENELECIKRNIIVRVDAINADKSVAYCSVEQRLTGFLRRPCSYHELVWQAEEALAPLKEMGTLPLLTVRHKGQPVAPTVNEPTARRSLMDVALDLWRWLGYPFSREGFGAVRLEQDPFGWKQAMLSSGLQVQPVAVRVR